MNPYESPNSRIAIPVAEDTLSTDQEHSRPCYVVIALTILAIISVLIIAFAIIYDLEIQADKEFLDKALKTDKL